MLLYCESGTTGENCLLFIIIPPSKVNFQALDIDNVKCVCAKGDEAVPTFLENIISISCYVLQLCNFLLFVML